MVSQAGGCETVEAAAVARPAAPPFFEQRKMPWPAVRVVVVVVVVVVGGRHSRPHHVREQSERACGMLSVRLRSSCIAPHTEFSFRLLFGSRSGSRSRFSLGMLSCSEQ